MSTAYEKLGIEIVVDKVTTVGIDDAIKSAVNKTDVEASPKIKVKGDKVDVKDVATVISKALEGLDLSKLLKGLDAVNQSLKGAGGGFAQVGTGAKQASKDIEVLGQKAKSIQEIFGKGFEVKAKTSGIVTQLQQDLQKAKSLVQEFSLQTITPKVGYTDKKIPSVVRDQQAYIDGVSILKNASAGGSLTGSFNLGVVAEKLKMDFERAVKAVDYINQLTGDRIRLTGRGQGLNSVIGGGTNNAEGQGLFATATGGFSKVGLDKVITSQFFKEAKAGAESQMQELQKQLENTKRQTLASRVASFGGINNKEYWTNNQASPLSNVAAAVSGDATKVKATLDDVKKGLSVISGESFNEFLKRNKDLVKEVESDWHRVQKILSDVYNAQKAPTPSAIGKGDTQGIMTRAEGLSLIQDRLLDERGKKARQNIDAENKAILEQKAIVEKRDLELHQQRTRLDNELISQQKQATAAERKDKSDMYRDMFDQIKTRQAIVEKRDLEKYLNPQTTRKSYESNVGTALNMAQVEQIRRVSDELQRMSVQSKGAGVSLTQVGEALQKFGLLGVELSKANFTKLNSDLKSFKAEVGQTDNALKALKQNNAFSFLGESMGKMATRLAEFYSIRTVLFTVGNQLRDATQASLDFNQSIHDIIAIAGESRDGMQAIGQSIWDISKASKYSAKEVAELMQVLAQAGVKAEQLPAVASSVGKFATGAGADPKMAADLFTTAMNVYDIKAEQAMKVTNALTAALNNSKLEASGLATAFNYLAPQAAQLGMSLEQTLGIISTMAQSGVKASTIGTGVSQMLKEFAAPKQRLKNLLEYYGLSAEDINPIKKSFAEIVDSLNSAKGKAGETGVAVEHMFSALESRVGRSAVAAINLGGDAFRNMTDSVTGTSAALIAYEKSMEGARARMNVIKQTFTEWVSGSLEKLAPLFITITDSLRGWLDLLATDLGKTIGACAAVVTGILAVAGAIKVLQAAIATSTALTTGGGIIARILGGTFLASNPVGWITAGILGLATAIGVIGYAWDSNKRDEEEATKATLKGIEARQAYLGVLQGVKTSMEHNNNGLKEYEKLLVTEGEKSGKVQELGQTKVKLTEDQRKSLSKYMLLYPEMFKGMDTEITTYEKLISVINRYKQAKFGDSTTAADKYNKIVAASVNQYREDQQSAKNVGLFYDPTDEKQRAAREKANLDSHNKRLNSPDAIKLREEAGGSQLQESFLDKGKVRTKTTSIMPGKETIDPVTGLAYRYLESKTTNDLVVNPGGSFNPSARNGAGTDKPFDPQKVLDHMKSGTNKVKVDAEVKTATEELAALKEEMKKAQEGFDETKFKELHDKAVTKIHEINNAKLMEVDTKYWDEVTGAFGGTFTPPKNFGTEGDAFGKAEIPGDKLAYFNKYKDQFLVDLKDRRSKQVPLFDAKDKNSSDRLPEYAAAPKAEEKPFNSNDTEKQQDRILRMKQQAINLQKDEIWTAEERKKLDEKMLQAEIDANTEKKNGYQHELKDLELSKEKAKTKEAIAEWENKHGTRLKDIKEKEEDIRDVINQQLAAKTKLANMTDYGRFKEGVRGAYASNTDTGRISEDFGGSVTNAGFTGATNAVQGSLNAIAPIDKTKINELKGEISRLNNEKNLIEKDIAMLSANTSLTPQELTTLSDKKVKLEEINNALNKQNKALKEQTNAWSAFTKGLQNMMKLILEELQRYIAKLIAVAIAKKIAGMAIGAVNTGTDGIGAPTGDMDSGLFNSDGTRTAAGSLDLLSKADGGMIPLSMGKAGVDSVPAMLMPGEIIIKRSSVEAIGPEKLLFANEHGRLPKFANGGLVGGGGKTGKGTSDGTRDITLQIVNVTEKDQVPNPGQDAQQIINVISADIAKRGPTYRSVKAAVQM